MFSKSRRAWDVVVEVVLDFCRGAVRAAGGVRRSERCFVQKLASQGRGESKRKSAKARKATLAESSEAPLQASADVQHSLQVARQPCQLDCNLFRSQPMTLGDDRSRLANAELRAQALPEPIQSLGRTLYYISDLSVHLHRTSLTRMILLTEPISLAVKALTRPLDGEHKRSATSRKRITPKKTSRRTQAHRSCILSCSTSSLHKSRLLVCARNSSVTAR